MNRPETMTEQDVKVEQNGAGESPERQKGIHVRIGLGKRFCIFAAVLAALVAGVFLAARFVPCGTPVGVYRVQSYACMHEGAKAMFVVTPDFHCFMIYYDEEADRGGHTNVFMGKWKQEEDGSFTFFDFVVGDWPEEHFSQMEPVLNGRSYWGGLKTTAPGEIECFLPRMLSAFL